MGCADALHEKTAGAGSPGTNGCPGSLGLPLEPPVVPGPSRAGSPPPLQATSRLVSKTLTPSGGLRFIAR
jgi:hypothetical protein